MFSKKACSSGSSSGTSAYRIAGFGCLLAWTYVVFFSRLVHYSTRNDITHLNSTYTFACCGMIAVLVLCALPWGRLIHRERAELAPEWYPSTRSSNIALAIATIVVVICTVALTFVEREYFKQPWCSIASTIAGAGVGILFLGWAPVFSRTTAPRSCAQLALAFTSGAFLFLLITSLPEPVALGATYLLPVLSAVGLWVERRAETPLGATPRNLPPAARSAFVRLLISLCLLGFSESLVRALLLEIDPVSDPPRYQWLFFLGTVVASAIVFLASRYRKNPARALNRASMFALVFLSLLAPIVWGTGFWGDIPVLICYCLFYLFMWATLSQTAQAYGIATRMLFGFGLGMAYVGCLAGTFIGSLLTSFAALDYRIISLIVLCCASITLVSLLFITDDRMLTTLMSSDPERPQAPRRFMLRINEAARTHHLTAKETEVLALAAKGRTTQRICEELGISTGTANTHLMHIYKKFDVHDRQQLLDMLEETGSS